MLVSAGGDLRATLGSGGVPLLEPDEFVLMLTGRLSRSTGDKQILELAGHGPGSVEMLEMTVKVHRSGTYMLRKETPASDPSSKTAGPVAWSQKPRP
jgi:hypothetical protein